MTPPSLTAHIAPARSPVGSVCRVYPGSHCFPHHVSTPRSKLLLVLPWITAVVSPVVALFLSCPSVYSQLRSQRDSLKMMSPCVPSLLKSTASARVDKERVEAEILQQPWALCGLLPLLSCPALPGSSRAPRSFWNKPKCSFLLGCDPFPEGSSHLFQVLAYFFFFFLAELRRCMRS